MDTTTRTPAQQAAYDRFMGTASTVREQQEQGVIDSEGNYTAEDTTTAPVVHVSRSGHDKRGRSATVFVDAPEGTPAEIKRAAIAPYLLPGETVWDDCIRRTNDDNIRRTEYAVYPA